MSSNSGNADGELLNQFMVDGKGMEQEETVIFQAPESSFQIPEVITEDAIARAARFYARKKANGKLYYERHRDKYREKGRERRALAREQNAGKVKAVKSTSEDGKAKRRSRPKQPLTEEARAARLEKDKLKRQFMRKAYQLYLEGQSAGEKSADTTTEASPVAEVAAAV